MKIRQKDCVCEIPQHAAVLGDERASNAAPRVESGPIAVLPESHDDSTRGGSEVFRSAAESFTAVRAMIGVDVMSDLMCDGVSLPSLWAIFVNQDRTP